MPGPRSLEIREMMPRLWLFVCLVAPSVELEPGPFDEGPPLEPVKLPGPPPRSWWSAIRSARWMSSIALEYWLMSGYELRCWIACV